MESLLMPNAQNTKILTEIHHTFMTSENKALVILSYNHSIVTMEADPDGTKNH